MLKEGWESIDLFGEVLEGADPVPRLHHQGANPALLDRYWDKLSQDVVQEEEEDDVQGHKREGGGCQVPEEPLTEGSEVGGGADWSPPKGAHLGLELVPLVIAPGDNMALTQSSFTHVTTNTWAYSQVFGFFKFSLNRPLGRFSQ